MDLVVDWGRVHALLGENGAGKSTLMNVVYGMVTRDAGEITFDGRPAHIDGPQDAIKLGIGMVHQHFMLIPRLSVVENIMLGRESVRGAGVIDMDRAARTVSELSARYGLEVDPRAQVGDLTVGLQQRVEIVKALYRGARLLILDEPTAALTPQETEGLFQIVRSLVQEGAAVIFITHKLAEVMVVADRITVMRRGKVVGTTAPNATTQAQLAQMMVGRSVLLRVDKGPAHPADAVLQIHDLVVQDDRHHAVVEGVNLTVRSGEIVGIAGVEGNGQNELVESLLGTRPVRAGRVAVGRRDITRRSTRSRLRWLSNVPADRHRMGLILEFSIADNLVLSEFDRPPYANGLVRLLRVIRDHALELMKAFDIRAQSPEQPAGSLSGGNQQKVVLARELSAQPKLLIASQPTRGLDVGSIEFVHSRLVSQRDKGLAILLVSSELDEVLSLSDRVAVMYRGKIVAELEGAGIDRDKIGLLMAGAG